MKRPNRGDGGQSKRLRQPGSDRRQVQNEYESSRFWYYAEVFTGSRLKNLLGSDVNLTKTLGKRNKPKLLCYYLLFPAHEQSVGADTCSGIEAQEVACHAGDWQCIAVLLEGDGADAPSYNPKYLGLTDPGQRRSTSAEANSTIGRINSTRRTELP